MSAAGAVETADGPSRFAQAAAPAAEAGSARRTQRVSRLVTRDDTLPLLLAKLGVRGEARNRWHNAVARELGVNHVLMAGDTVHFHFTAPGHAPDRGALTALHIDRAGVGRLSWVSQGGGIVQQGDRSPVTALVEPEAPPPEPAAASSPGPKAPQAPSGDVSSDAAASVRHGRGAAPVTHVLRKGETLGRVLRRNGVSVKAQQPWIKAIGKRYSLKRLYPGRRIVLYFAAAPPADGSERRLRALQIESPGGDLLTWQWTEGRIVYRGKNHRVAPGKTADDAADTTSDAATAPPARGTARAAPRGASPPTRSFDPLERISHRIDRGQTLRGILRRLGVAGQEAAAWVGAIDKQYPVTRLLPGQTLRLYFAEAPAGDRGGNLKSVALEAKKGRTLTWERIGRAVRFGAGNGPGRGRTAAANGAATNLPQDAFLSEYALARIKQRNGLLEYIPPPRTESNGTPSLPSLDMAERITHRLRQGEHLWGLLQRYEENEANRRLWLTGIQGHAAVRRLQAGTPVVLYFRSPAHANGAGRLQAIEIALRSDLRLTWYRDDSGIRLYRDEIPYQQELRSIHGVVTHGSLYRSASAAGLDPHVISRMVDILGWDINFQRDLRPGDTYRVLYRRKFRQGHPESARIHLLAAEVVNNGLTHTAFYFEGADGNGNYYNAAGHPVSRSFLRYPVEFSRISSHFSTSRFHPVLKVRRPHYGVDFAAPAGTPIRAAADGRITYRDWKGGYGRLVEISHGRAIKTRYAHLGRYGPGIRRGTAVKRGQTIGYVGCSGLCTGPHLHFEMWQADRYVDPLRADIPLERQLDPLLMEIFRTTKARFLQRLRNGNGRGNGTSDPSKPS